MSNSAKFDSTIKAILYILGLSFFALNTSAKLKSEDQGIKPLSSNVLFTKNKGQWHQNVLYQGKFKGGKVFLENKAFTFLFYPKEGLESLHYKLNNPDGFSDVLNFHTVKMEFVNGNELATKLEIDSNAFYENFYLDNDPRHWATHVKSFKQIHYQSLYDHINVNALSDRNNFRYDLVLNPGADVNDIELKLCGQHSLRLVEGDLMIATEVGEIKLTAPKAYQTVNGKYVKVNCTYQLSESRVKFVLGNYNPQFPVIIDPTLVFATYTGSQSDNFGMTATYDVSGNAYTAGVCFGPYYPVTPGAFQITYMGPSTITNKGTDISISKFNPSGTSLLYSTYLGGSGNEAPQSIVVDNANQLVVFGRTASTNFPVTSGVFQSTIGGSVDFIVSKFNINGTALSASTYMGGSAKEGVNGSTALSGLHYNYSDDLRGGVIVDANNNIYFGACTTSSDFPVTPGCLQSTLNGTQDACVVKFDPNLTAPIYSTFLGGAMQDAVYSVAINTSNQLYITGGTESSDFPSTPGTLHSSSNGAIDGFVGLLSAGGNNLLASTFIGTNAYDQSYFVQLDNQNKVYILGQTEGAYPVSSGVYANLSSGQFIHCMNANLTSTYFSTVVGRSTGFPDIVPSAFMVDVCGSIYLSGWGGTLGGNNNSHSATSGLPVTPNAFMPNTDNEDFYFMVLNKDALSLQYASFFGGNQSHEHVDGGTSRFDKAGIIYQAICESCGGHDDMPTTPGAWSSTNNSSNCNNAVVKFAFTPNLVAAQLAANPGLTGCAPFTVDFLNHSVNGVSYVWTFGDGTSSTLFEPVHTYTTAGTYQIRLISHNNATCNIFDTTYITVNVLPPIVLNPISNPGICKGDTVTINFNAPSGSTYTWSPNFFMDNVSNMQPNVWPASDQTYFVAIEKNGCKVVDSVEVSVFDNTTIILLDSAHMCLDDTVRLHADQVNSSYQWNTGQTTQSIDVLEHGWYYLNVIDANGCKANDSIRVDSLHRVPLISYTMAICQTERMQLIAPQGNYTYEWSPIKNISSFNVYDPFINPLTSTIYSLTLFNGPCKSEATYDVSVFPMPSLTVTPKSSEILPGETITLNSISDTIATWYPDYALSCQQCNLVIVSPDVNTIYYAVVANDYGCKRIDSVEVKVTPSLYIPNSFTPNGDLVNDIFRPVFSGYTEIELLIFDRWGELIFSTNELNGGWDGKRKNVNCPLDVYVYKLTAKDYKNRTIEKVGHVTLVR